LYDLQRQPRLVAAAYRVLLGEFGQITIVPHGELFAVMDQPARLKVEVQCIQKRRGRMVRDVPHVAPLCIASIGRE
jgi:hypothetical protein